jgi:hypothetical protein
MYGSIPPVLPLSARFAPPATYPPFYVTLTTETQVWYNRCFFNSGVLPSYSDTILINNLSLVMAAQSYSSHIIVLYPFVGSLIKHSIVPLRDLISAGIPDNYASNLVDSDCGTNKGVAFNGSNKGLRTGVHTTQLGALVSGGTPHGGLGWFERNFAGASPGLTTVPMGLRSQSNTNRWVLDLRNTSYFFSWGLPANFANVASAASNKHYYGEGSSITLRTLYQDGTSVATNTTSDAPPISFSDADIFLGGDFEGAANAFYKGTCGCAYITDGGLGSTNAAAFHTLLTTYIITATGR